MDRPAGSNRLAWGILVAIALAGVYWFSQDEQDHSAAHKDAASTQAKESVVAHGNAASVGNIGSPAALAPQATAPSAPAVRLRFESPPSVSVGQAFDYLVTVEALQPVGRISLQLAYDHKLLRARVSEEVDYTGRTGGERSFVVREVTDGRVLLRFDAPPGSAPVQAERMVVVQFEAIAPGSAQVGVEKIEALDTASNELSVAVPDRERLVVVN